MTEYPLLNALIFAALGVTVFAVAFSIVSKLLPFDLKKDISRRPQHRRRHRNRRPHPGPGLDHRHDDALGPLMACAHRLRRPGGENITLPASCATLISMLFESDKVMFEIYKETEYTGKYRVVYFTELQDHNKETEINHALAGEHYFDGFIKNFGKDEAKEIINSLLSRLNSGERVDAQEVERALGEHLA